MVSENVALTIIVIVVYVLMLSGILYSESGWFYVCSQRMDLEFLLACLMFLSLYLIITRVHRNGFGPNGHIFCHIAYFSIGLISSAGAQMIASLVWWNLQSSHTNQMKSAFDTYMVAYIFYWVVSILILVGFGFMYPILLRSDHRLKAVEADRTNMQEVRYLTDRIVKNPQSMQGIQACLRLLKTYGQNRDSTAEFKRFVFVHYLGSKKCVTFRTQSSVPPISCSICGEQVLIRERLCHWEEVHLRTGPNKEAYNNLQHLSCLFASQFHSAVLWADVSQAVIVQLLEKQQQFLSAIKFPA